MGKMVNVRDQLIKNGLLESYLNGTYILPSSSDIIIHVILFLKIFNFQKFYIIWLTVRNINYYMLSMSILNLNWCLTIKMSLRVNTFLT